MARSGQYQRDLRESQAQLQALRETHSQLAVEHARMLVTVCKPVPWLIMTSRKVCRHSTCDILLNAASVTQISELEAELLNTTSPLQLNSPYAASELSAQELSPSRGCTSFPARADADEARTPCSAMSMDEPASASSSVSGVEPSSSPEPCVVLHSAMAAAATAAEGDTMSQTSSCGLSPRSALSTFSFDSGSDVSLDEDGIQAECQTPHGRLTVYTHGRVSAGRPSMACSGGLFPIKSRASAGGLVGATHAASAPTAALRRVLQPVDVNSQDDSPAPAVPDSVTMMRRKELADKGAAQPTISTHEV